MNTPRGATAAAAVVASLMLLAAGVPAAAGDDDTTRRSASETVARFEAALARRDPDALRALVDAKEIVGRQLFGERAARDDPGKLDRLWEKEGDRLTEVFVGDLLARPSPPNRSKDPATYRPRCRERVRGNEALVVLRMPATPAAFYRLRRATADDDWRIVELPTGDASR